MTGIAGKSQEEDVRERTEERRRARGKRPPLDGNTRVQELHHTGPARRATSATRKFGVAYQSFR
jgi:hypothetical protein